MYEGQGCCKKKLKKYGIVKFDVYCSVVVVVVVVCFVVILLLFCCVVVVFWFCLFV